MVTLSKIRTAVIMIIAVILSLTSCVEYEYTPDVSREDVSITKPVEKYENIPNEIKQLRRDYSSILASNDFAFRLDDNEPYTYNKSNGDYGTTYQYDLNFLFEKNVDTSEERQCSIWHHYYNNIPNSHVSLFMVSADCSKAFLDFITATIMVYGKNNDLDNAIESAKNMLRGFNDSNYSNALDIGDYIICLSPYTEGSDACSLHIVDKTRLYSDFDKNSYKQMNDTLYQSAAHSIYAVDGTYFYFKGKVLSINTVRDTMATLSKQIKVKSSYGTVYEIRQSYEYMPIDYSVGKTYTFYGYVRDNSDFTYNYYGNDFFQLSYAE